MKINCELKTNRMFYEMAELCAKVIAEARTRQHLLLLHKAGLGNGSIYEQAVVNDDFRDVQAVIRGMNDPWERWRFICTVKHYHRELWKHREVRGRDYVASVRAIENRRAA